MLKRKINAAVSLLTTVLLLAHAISLSVYMLTGGRSFRPAGFMGWALMGVMIVHALISIDLALSAHAEENTRKGKQYPKLNVPTIVQRATGLLMVPAAALHIAGATGAMVPPKMVHAIVPPLFFALVLSHVAISTGKALITLGIGSAKCIRIVNLVMKLICGATLIAGVIGICLQTFGEGSV